MLCTRRCPPPCGLYHPLTIHRKQSVRSASKLSAIKRGLVREERQPQSWTERSHYPSRPGQDYDASDLKKLLGGEREGRTPRSSLARPPRADFRNLEATTHGSTGTSWEPSSRRRKALVQQEPSRRFQGFEFTPRMRSDAARDARLGTSRRSERIVTSKDFLTPGGSLPLTTAASSWVYGTSAALACLQAGRRTIYKAYLGPQILQAGNSHPIRKLLHAIPRTHKYEMTTPMHMDAMSSVTGRRPHQGILLEVSPLPFPPAKSMERPSLVDKYAQLTFQLGEQRREEVEINKKGLHLQAPDPNEWRSPLVLLLDGIKDEGNMGNIIRTAYFYGIEAVAICVNTCAPISSPIVAKAASGAIEAMPLLRIDRPSDFVRKSQLQGWEIWASVPPASATSTAAEGKMFRTTAELQTPLEETPSILMLGSEGDGLRGIMLDRADGFVTITSPGGNHRELIGVDSLNVASAAAVLLEAFMLKPEDDPEQTSSDALPKGLGEEERDGAMW